MNSPLQAPSPNSRLLRHRGDVLTVTLTLPRPAPGSAWLRTNLGQADTRRNEVVRHVEDGEAILERDWHDLPMRPLDEQSYEISLPLLEAGRFQAKAFFLPQGGPPRWPDGDNVIIKVEPAEFLAASSIYCAFVRQFGQNGSRGAVAPSHAAAIEELECDGYEVLPRSGKFRDLIAQLDHVIGDLGFRIIQLLPIFPTPTTYARMGRFGSPFAALDLMDVDPALAEFDRKTTPLDQFKELIDETHRRQAKLFLDIPINHTGWASWLQNHHPEWFKRRDDGTEFESPGAWGVTWGDLSELDYSHRELWHYMADVFLFWCRNGVDGFRCDAGYMIPLPVWEYITAKVRLEFPDTIFLLEGLGGDKNVVFDLLDRANLNWAYSELFQNHTRGEVEAILTESIAVSNAQGVQVHFAETHDNNRLAATSQTHARMRTALAALCSHSGGFGLTCGVEWFASVKIEVHGGHSLNWGNDDHQIAEIRRINTLLAIHPAFAAGAILTLIPHPTDGILILERKAQDGASMILVLVNLDADNPAVASWNRPYASFPEGAWDLLTGEHVLSPLPQDLDSARELPLAPGQALCLSGESSWLIPLDAPDSAGELTEPVPSQNQRARAKALELYQWFQPETSVDTIDLESAVNRLRRAPVSFCRELQGDDDAPPPCVRWQWPRDTRRVVLWPERTLLAVEAGQPFIAELRRGKAVLRRELSQAAIGEGHDHFTLIYPPPQARHRDQETLSLHLTVFAPGGIEHCQGDLLMLSQEAPSVLLEANKTTVLRQKLYGLCTNGRGAMAHVRGDWGDIRSQYDALLAANPHPDYPVDRRILLTRLRGWIVHRDYSREIDRDCLGRFAQDRAGALQWSFEVPTGMGRHLRLELRLRLVPESNTAELTFHRLAGEDDPVALDDEAPVQLILRPDIEDRGFHEKTKALWGPEETWPQAIQAHRHGFVFHPSGDGCGLKMDAADSKGTFVHEPEWHYMVTHPIDANRGLDGSSDLFSPGYFSFALPGKACVSVVAQLPGEETPESQATAVESEGAAWPLVGSLSLAEAAKQAISAFIVKRDDTKTVIAGYPWFLDWGRDTLICLRGIIAAGMLDEARDIVRQFARFEKDGTLPNMIRGQDDSNRDTSDAPLWLFVACADLLRADGDDAFLHSDCGSGRSIVDVLESIVRGYLTGTPNGIRVDASSGLVFSPSHFTWMDTNHPAGTPREGYPIEIQALWHAALSLLEQLRPGSQHAALRQTVSASIETHFWKPDLGYLADCLHASPGESARQATADDHLRPNQLFAVTFGAVTDRSFCQGVIQSCEELLVPGGLRSLAERPVRHPLPVKRDGHLLNDPAHPYWGCYEGDEDTRRKPAYHNGTAWTWPFPSYAEALSLTYGAKAASTAKAILSSSAQLFNQGCLGQIPEILDGDAPHTERGCGAQAWSVTELFRVWNRLEAS